MTNNLLAVLDGKAVTKILIVSTTALLMLYNLVKSINKHPTATITEIIIKLIQDHPVVIFLAGVIYGHLFWGC